MVATYVSEKPQKIKYTKGVLTAKRVLQFKTERNDSPSVFVGHLSLPAIGSPHPSFPSAFCNDLELDQQASGVEWIATLTYSSEREMKEDPIEERPRISWDGEMYTEAIAKDINGDAILNSAGDYFIDPSPIKEKSHLIAKIRSNVQAVPQWVLTYRDVINSSAITIDGLAIPAEKALIHRPQIGEEKLRNDVYYREVAIDVHIHPDGWKMNTLDAGFRKKASSKREQIKDDNGDEPTTPVPLDGAGNFLEDPNPSNAVFLEFDVRETKDFTILPGIS